MRNIRESPSDKCVGFDISLRGIKQLKHHIYKLTLGVKISQQNWKSLPLDTSQIGATGIADIKLVFWIALHLNLKDNKII